jgi:tellurite resistance protein
MKALAAHYCRKVDHVGEEANIRFEFDGERVETEQTIGSIGVEDRDMIDVICGVGKADGEEEDD